MVWATSPLFVCRASRSLQGWVPGLGCSCMGSVPDSRLVGTTEYTRSCIWIMSTVPSFRSRGGGSGGRNASETIGSSCPFAEVAVKTCGLQGAYFVRGKSTVPPTESGM
jgi:hypothetical protein